MNANAVGSPVRHGSRHAGKISAARGRTISQEKAGNPHIKVHG